MPYALTQAADVMAIAGCDRGTGAAVQFTGFTSRLGATAKVTGQNDVIGIHLVLVDASNTFSAAGVASVTAVRTAQNYDNTT